MKVPALLRLGLAAAMAAATLAMTPAVLADGLDSLTAFLRDAQSGSASFVQTVTSPPRQDRESQVRRSGGQFVFQRPGRFRFDYTQPYQQHIVADGSTLWFYDVDLEQVTAQAQERVLGQTPAALIASAADLQALDGEFELLAEPDVDGLEWVRATPREREGQLQSVRIGFADGALAQLEIVDGFGQTSLLEFSELSLNQPLAADAFDFQVPEGVDVLQQ